MKIYSALILLLLIFTPRIASAQTMENELYEIQDSDVRNFDYDSLVSDTIFTVTPKAPGEFSGKNYTVRLGNNYSPAATPIIFSIPSLRLDFGILSPTNPVARASKLSVGNNSSYTYKVIASENNQLTEAKTGAKIPDTTCNEGKCSETISGKWDSTLAYGLGYRCDDSGSQCVAGDGSFQQSNFYKQLPDSSLGESASTVLSEGAGKTQEATVTYKVNISTSQPQGFYLNTVTFLLIPSY